MRRKPLSKIEKSFLRDLGARLRTIRMSKGWTLEQTEEHGWHSWQQLQRLETGRSNASITTLKKVAQLYKMSLGELLRGL